MIGDKKRTESAETYRRRRWTAHLGLWVFLGSEAMLFGSLALGFIGLRMLYPEPFAVASAHLKTALGTLNTAILLTSSLTMALAVHAARGTRRVGAPLFLFGTAALGVLFLTIKGYEYYQEYHDHLVPWWSARDPALSPPVQLFFVCYFFLTGAHALHLLLGIIIVLMVCSIDTFSALRIPTVTVECVGLYWHFVDIVWIFLFPLLYLYGGPSQ
ncbi:MAG: cytochrome c oxidase subunit 3 [Bdellovibrionales bacterium]|nr:cytochrome c oxidase subunit 3 [Bdellovibrionales bacterium]